MSLYGSTRATMEDDATETLKKILQVLIEGGVAMALYADDHPSINDSSTTTLKKILDVLNGVSGGAPVGAQAVFTGHYGGGAPTQTPTTSAALAYDLDAPHTTWMWDGSAWF